MDDSRRPGQAGNDPATPPQTYWWAWALLLAGIAVATAAFFGYGQVELLLDAANLRYCG